MGGDDVTPWQNLFLFASSVLTVHHPKLPSRMRQRKLSLTTVIKHQAEAFPSALSPLGLSDTVLKKRPTSKQSLRRSVECKLADGDVTGAVRLLSSDASLAPCNLEITVPFVINTPLHLLI